MGRVLFGGGKVGMEPPSAIKPVFADTTWANIILACQTNTVPDTWAVGDQKAMIIGGTEYMIDIIGKNHDNYADGSGNAPLTFQLHDSYGTTYSMNSTSTNAGGWRNSIMRNTNLPIILSVMPLEVSSAIKQVTKQTSCGEQSTTIETTNDGLFLLSEVEVLGTYANSYSGEGRRYQYYDNGGSMIKNVNGSPHSWSTRSPGRPTLGFAYLNTGGEPKVTYGTSLVGVAPAFCF